MQSDQESKRNVRIVKRLITSERAKQFGQLAGMQGVGLLASFSLTALITRGLEVDDYGKFRYGITFLALGTTLLQGGWPYSTSRLLALQSEHEDEKQIVGASLILLGGFSIFGALVVSVGVVVARAVGFNPPSILLWLAPFLYIPLGQYAISNICQGLNRINVLSFQQVLPYLVLIPLTATQIFLLKHYTLQAAIASYIGVFTLVILIGFMRLGATLTRSRLWLVAIARENKQTGFPIYLGGVVGVASTQLISVLVAEFVNPSFYGKYALALAVSAPVAMTVSSIGTVIFRASSRLQTLSPRFLLYSFGFGVSLVIVFTVGCRIALVRLFGSQYAESVWMAQLMGVGALMIGWGDILQRFLGAKGKGRHLCIAATCTGVVNLATASVLLPKFAAYGAISSSLIAAATYLGLNTLLFYRYAKDSSEARSSGRHQKS